MANEVGKPIVEGIALGIESGIGSVSGAVQNVVNSALMSTLDAQFAPSTTTSGPSSVSNVSRTNNYNLNVSSSQKSQGITNDFSILQVMAFDN